MLEPKEPALGIDQDPDRVEADLAGTSWRCPSSQPGSREAAQACSLRGAQPFEWHGRRVASARACPPGLDLHERENDAIECNQVDLAMTRARIAVHDRAAATFEVRGGEIFAQAAEGTARIRVSPRPARTLVA